MPWLQRIATQASAAGAAENLGETKRRLEENYGVAPDKDEQWFSAFLGTVLDRELESEEKTYVDAISEGVKSAVESAITDAARRDTPFYIQWAPGYDYQASVWDAKAGATDGGVIIMVSGPYPRSGASSGA